MNVLGRFAAMVLALAPLFTLVPPAAGQYAKPPRDPSAIQRKVERSAEFQRKALDGLSDPGQAERFAGSAYTELKSAYDDMVMNASNRKTPDPVLNLSTVRTDQALRVLIGAWDALKTRDRAGVDAAVATARERLQQSLQLTNIVVATGF